MAECYRCGISEDSERLFGAISNKGVVKICKKCASEDGLPLIQPADLNKPEKTQSVYERLSRMANLDPNKHRINLSELERERALNKQRGGVYRRKEDTFIKKPLNSSLDAKKSQLREDLVHNYHWILMRARRAKKLTQKQLAENIGESENSIRCAEEGKLSKDTNLLVKKLENYLGVKLGKGGEVSSEGPRFVNTEGLSESEKKELLRKIENGKFDSESTNSLTIGDLKEEKNKKEKSGGLFSFFRKKKKEESDSEEIKDISDEEADEVLYGK